MLRSFSQSAQRLHSKMEELYLPAFHLIKPNEAAKSGGLIWA